MSNRSIENFPPHMQRKINEQIAKEDKALADRRAGLRPANVELDTVDEATPTLRDEGRIKRANLFVHTRTPHLGDCDGRSLKAVLDAFIDAGLLEDDGPEDIESVTFTQAWAKEEKTTIRLEWYEEEK